MKRRPKSIEQVLNETWPNSQFSAAQKKADYNSQIERELALCLPKEWQDKVIVQKYQNGILHLGLTSAGLKMRFNAIRLDLLSHLRQSIPDLVSISDSIVVTTSSPISNHSKSSSAESAHQKHHSLSDNSAQTLLKTAEQLPDNLKQALQGLVKASRKH
ncbi:hypothetical protein C2869_21070 [Saccharobesus litoralis]|uniref:DUF721 domain-containing protein n=1 Tax=Saccharobesus litoralis TaxID=2172099 RepID=A0A2S0VWY8_9ALTE|nr:DciA family protein [Saccharobesus litoralis]AWB68734.1 hypothetical protein C2869_21070 [Saccharobesus litoralis]